MSLWIKQESDESAPKHVEALGQRYHFEGMNPGNFWAFYRLKRDSFLDDESFVATYLTLWKQDPCDHGLSNWCPHAAAHAKRKLREECLKPTKLSEMPTGNRSFYVSEKGRQALLSSCAIRHKYGYKNGPKADHCITCGEPRKGGKRGK